MAATQESAMLRDDSGNGGGRPSAPRNVLGDRLDVCSMKPKTGFFRDGCCNTGREGAGSHTVCAVMTAAFLEFSKSLGGNALLSQIGRHPAPLFVSANQAASSTSQKIASATTRSTEAVTSSPLLLSSNTISTVAPAVVDVSRVSSISNSAPA